MPSMDLRRLFPVVASVEGGHVVVRLRVPLVPRRCHPVHIRSVGGVSRLMARMLSS